MSHSPRVSIISANFNKGAHVTDCVQSVLEQTEPRWELLFVDDGSTDGSLEMARDISNGDSRCKFLKNDTGVKGANAARNLGIEMSQGEFVIFLDSDDVLKRDCLELRLKAFVENPNCDFVVFPMGIFYNEVGDSDIVCNIPTEEDDLVRFLKRDIVWQISGPIWKRTTLKSLKGFDLELHSQQDIDLHIRALAQGLPYRYFHVSPDVFYRRNVDSIPRKESQSLAHFQQRYEMILRHYKMLKTHERLNNEVKTALASYILDLGQMMRWHIAKLGKPKALKLALEYWRRALEYQLVSKKEYRLGIRYIKFKHQMFYNRFPKLQNSIADRYKRQLGELIYTPSKTYCTITLTEYGG